MRTGKISGAKGEADVGGFLSISNQLPGSVFVLAHYDSGASKDTEITIINSGLLSVRVHLFFIAPTGFLSENAYVTVAPGTSEMVRTSILDSGNTGLVLGVASDLTGNFISYNYLTASGRYYDTNYDGTFPAFIFKCLVSETVGTPILRFNGLFLEPQPYDMGLFDIRPDSFVAFTKLSGSLETGIDLFSSLSLKSQGSSGSMSKFVNAEVCQISGVLSTIYPELSGVLGITGRLWANCAFGMVIDKTNPLRGLSVDTGTRVSATATIPVIP